MAIPNDNELLRLLRGGESHRVEFKESLSGDAANRVREAACAFANDLPGDGLPGVAFVGVRDDGSPTGAPVTDELLRQLADVKRTETSCRRLPCSWRNARWKAKRSP